MAEVKNVVARILYVAPEKDKVRHVAFMIGDRQIERAWEGPAPSVGDIFLVSNDVIPRILKQIGHATVGAWGMNGDAMRWRKPTPQGKTRMEVLWQRHRIRRAVRAYLDGEGFIEIDAPLLVHGTTPDRTIQSFAVSDQYLTTSTEHHIKRLEVGGFEKIYTLTKNFRFADGEGHTHNPEFTMLEWDRVCGTLADAERDAENIFMHAHRALGGQLALTYQGHHVDLTPPWPRLTVAEIIQRFIGTPLADFELASVRRAVESAGLEIHDDWKKDRDFLFSVLMDHLQQYIGYDKPTFVTNWPAFMTSMAPVTMTMDSHTQIQMPNMSERSELYVCGLELSNGFPSVTDPTQQEAGFKLQQERRKRDGKDLVTLDKKLIASQHEGLPPCTGMAMGFDRLVMILTDQADIRATLAFAWDEL